MTVRVHKESINLREKLSELDKPSGIAGQDILKADTPQEVFNYINAGRRNLIINGAMQVAQRGTSSTGVTSNGYWASDRFRNLNTDGGTWTISQDTDAPDGFAYSQKYLCTSAQTSTSGSEELGFQQRVEAQDLQLLSYGSSNAKSMTFSFWVKSNKTGTYILWIYQPDGNRHIQGSYTIDAADTWEYKTVTIAGDVSGTINNDNGYGFQLQWMLKAGATYTSGTAATSWETLTTANRYVGQTVNVADATSNYWQITGVQLEVGSVATPFEHRSFGEELALCQRYYYQLPKVANGVIGSGHVYNSTSARANVFFPVPMRANPTFSIGDITRIRSQASSAVNVTPTGYGIVSTSRNAAWIYVTGTGWSTPAPNTMYYTDEAQVTFDAEL
jgi:hypothetical protein